MAFMRYGDQFRMQRRMMQQTFNSQAVKSLSELLRKRIMVFLGKVLEDEGSYLDANEKCVRIKTLSSLKAEYCF